MYQKHKLHHRSKLPQLPSERLHHRSKLQECVPLVPPPAPGRGCVVPPCRSGAGGSARACPSGGNPSPSAVVATPRFLPASHSPCWRSLRSLASAASRGRSLGGRVWRFARWPQKTILPTRLSLPRSLRPPPQSLLAQTFTATPSCIR